MTATTAGFELKEKCEALRNMLLEKHPRMPTLLQEIHQALRAQPENVTLLSEEEIAIVVQGLKVQTGIEFVKAASKAPSATAATKKKIAELGADAF